jgi:hypothetical protein
MVVEEDDIMLRRQTVRHLRIPGVHIRGEVIEEQDWKPRAAAEATVCVPDIIGFSEPSGRRFVGVNGHQRGVLQWLHLSSPAVSHFAQQEAQDLLSSKTTLVPLSRRGFCGQTPQFWASAHE